MTTTTLSPSRGVVICDLDNCLVDDLHRIPFIDWSKSVLDGRYDRYHALSALDGPANPDLARRLKEFSEQGHDIAFCTARPLAFRPQTSDWLARNLAGIVPMERTSLLMRNNDDHRPSVTLKREMAAALINEYGYKEIVAAFDDHFDVVLMYREHGFDAIQIAIHAVSAYEPPAPGASPANAPKRAPDHLEAGAATFRERNAIYGDTYLLFGQAMCAAFPDGIHIQPGEVEAMNRLGIYVQCLGKLLRYGPNLAAGGHADSAHDLMVYGAMLSEVTK